MGKAAIGTILCFCPLPLLNNVEKQWGKLVPSYVMSLQHCIGGEGGFLNILSNFPIIFCHWLSDIYQEKKDEVLYMLSQITQICFNERDNVMLLSMMNIMTENTAKMTHDMSQ